MNNTNAIKTLAKFSSSVDRSMRYVRSEWSLVGNVLHYAVREDMPDGGSFHDRRAVTLPPYEAKAARKVAGLFA